MFIAAGLMLSASAIASPMLSLSVQEDGLAPLTASSGTGFVQISGSAYNDFIITTAAGSGSPVLTAPGINLQTLDITTNSLAASHTLTVMLTQTGLTSLNNSVSMMNSFQGLLSGITSATLSSYIDPTNSGAHAAGNLLATTTFTASGANAVNLLGSASTSGMFSETEVITAIFAPTSTGDSLNASATVTAAAPEPTSIALMGAGLIGFTFFRRRTAKK
jgi:hypothetical protein